MKPWLAMLLLGPVVFGCSKDRTSSARLRISVDSVPFIDIADADAQSDPVFELPTGASRFANGTIAVGDYYGGKVVFFDSTGRFVRNVGRRGKGPGEYEIVMWRGACAGDTVFVVEPVKRRTDALASDGTVTRTFEDTTTSSLIDCRRNGSALGWLAQPMTRMPTAQDPPRRGELRLIPSRGRERSLGEFEWGLYGPMRPLNAIALADDVVYVANGTSGAIDVWSYRGNKLRSFDSGARQRPASDQHFEAALDRWVWYLPVRDEREEMKQLMRARFPKPDRLPAITDLAVDREGMLWVVTSHPGDGHTRMEMFTATGSAAGAATLPVELTIFEIGADYLLGSFEDAEGFPHVALYRVKRTTAS